MYFKKQETNNGPTNTRTLRNIINSTKPPLSKQMNKKYPKFSDKGSSYFQKLKSKIQNYSDQSLLLAQIQITEEPKKTEEKMLELPRSKSFRKNEQIKVQVLKTCRKMKQYEKEELKECRQHDKKIIKTSPSLEPGKLNKTQLINYDSFQSLLNNGFRLNKVEIKQILGSGASAKVKLASTKTDTYAIKIYEKYSLIEAKKKKRVYGEIKILGTIGSHPNIIKLFQAYEDKRQIHLIFEQIQGAITLHSHFRDSYLALDEQTIFLIVRKVLNGLHYLHSCGVAHRDIKPDNILLSFKDGSLNVKLIDFGFATTLVKAELTCGTPNFMAPELFGKSQKYCPFKVDSWAVGVMIFYLCEGRYPFKGFDEKDLYRNIRLGSYSIKKTKNEKLKTMIDEALRVSPEERASISDLLERID